MSNSHIYVIKWGKVLLGLLMITNLSLAFNLGSADTTVTSPTQLEPPQANPGGGTKFLGDTAVVLSHPRVPEAIIRYTTDGAAPDSNSLIAIDPIVLNNLTILKAVAFAPTGEEGAYFPSNVATFFYIPVVSSPTPNVSNTTFSGELQVVLSSVSENSNIFYGLNSTTLDQKYTAGDTIRLNQSTVVRAIAIRDGWTPSDTMLNVYIKNAIEITNVSNQAVPYLTEGNESYKLVFQTTAQGFSEMYVSASSEGSGDSDNFLLTLAGTYGNYNFFEGTIPLEINKGSAVINDNKSSTQLYDKLSFTWVNPLDNNEKLEGSVLVRPAPKQSNLIFMDPDFNLIDRVFFSQHREILVILDDQGMNPDSSYSILVSNRLGSSENGTSDFYQMNPTLLGANYYGIRVPLDVSAANNQDQTLQVLALDQILAVYEDPVDGDRAIKQLSFNQFTSVSMQLEFPTFYQLKMLKNTGEIAEVKIPGNNRDEMELVLYNMQGKMIHILSDFRSDKNNNIQWNVEHLERGTYFLKAISGSRTYSYKLTL